MEIFVLITSFLLVCAVFFLSLRCENQEDYAKCFESIEFSTGQRPVVTVAANGILIDSNFQLVTGVSQVLHSITQYLTLFVFIQVASASEVESAIHLTRCALTGLIDEDNILVSQTSVGRTAMARQLESSLHIEVDPHVAELSALFCTTALIGSQCGNVRFSAPSFVSLFQRHGKELAVLLAQSCM